MVPTSDKHLFWGMKIDKYPDTDRIEVYMLQKLEKNELLRKFISRFYSLESNQKKNVKKKVY